MQNTQANKPTKEDKDAQIVAYVVALVHARRQGNYLAASDAHNELVRRGVLVKFPRERKGAGNV